MKLISLNVEGRRHLNLVHNFLTKEDPEVICLMEAEEYLIKYLESKHYHTTFAPMCEKEQDGVTFVSGTLFVSKHSHSAEIFYYQQPNDILQVLSSNNPLETTNHPVIFAHYQSFNIAITHFTWNPKGESYFEPQATDLSILRDFLANRPPHILCGDMNIPRHINPLYPKLVEGYTDAVPQEYKSSLDKSLHRHGNNASKKILFESFMVDYLLTHSPYQAQNVRLEFGISDHAGIVAEIDKIAGM